MPRRVEIAEPDLNIYGADSSRRICKAAMLLSLLIGLGGLLYSGTLAREYLQNLPRYPDPAQGRMVPREVAGVVIYETETEDRKIKSVEDTAAGILVCGIGLLLIYAYKWGLTQVTAGEREPTAM